MSAWKHISRYDLDRMWDFVNVSLRFRPNNCNAIIAPGMKHRVIDISRYYSPHISAAQYKELRQQFLSVFRSLTSPTEHIYALDWENESYVLFPYTLDAGDQEEWPISPFPNGHIVYFITTDQRNVYCADGINMRIYLIGDILIRQFKLYEPEIFR